MHHFQNAGGWWMDLPLLLNATPARSSSVLRAKQLSDTGSKGKPAVVLRLFTLRLSWDEASHLSHCSAGEKTNIRTEIILVADDRGWIHTWNKSSAFFVTCHCHERNLILVKNKLKTRLTSLLFNKSPVFNCSGKSVLMLKLLTWFP